RPRPILEEVGWSDWARRGRFLAMVRQEGAERLLEIRDARAARQRILFRTGGAISWVRISPDEQRVAFLHHPSRFHDAGEVRVARVDGSGVEAWSPAFERCAGLAWKPGTGEVWFTATLANIYNTMVWKASSRKSCRPVYSFPDFLALHDVSAAGCL